MLESLAPALALALAIAPPPPDSEANLKRVIANYVRLYRRETLPQWRELFLPTFTVASTVGDGSIRLRSLGEFYDAQERYLASGRAIKEELENVVLQSKGRLASVWADFVLTEEGERSRGKLCLLLIEERGSWRIQSLVFAYDDANTS